MFRLKVEVFWEIAQCHWLNNSSASKQNSLPKHTESHPRKPRILSNTAERASLRCYLASSHFLTLTILSPFSFEERRLIGTLGEWSWAGARNLRSLLWSSWQIFVHLAYTEGLATANNSISQYWYEQYGRYWSTIRPPILVLNCGRRKNLRKMSWQKFRCRM
jgi:hypothetical protein